MKLYRNNWSYLRNKKSRRDTDNLNMIQYIALALAITMIQQRSVQLQSWLQSFTQPRPVKLGHDWRLPCKKLYFFRDILFFISMNQPQLIPNTPRDQMFPVVIIPTSVKCQTIFRIIMNGAIQKVLSRSSAICWSISKMTRRNWKKYFSKLKSSHWITYQCSHILWVYLLAY